MNLLKPLFIYLVMVIFSWGIYKSINFYEFEHGSGNIIVVYFIFGFLFLASYFCFFVKKVKFQDHFMKNLAIVNFMALTVIASFFVGIGLYLLSNIIFKGLSPWMLLLPPGLMIHIFAWAPIIDKDKKDLSSSFINLMYNMFGLEITKRSSKIN